MKRSTYILLNILTAVVLLTGCADMTAEPAATKKPKNTQVLVGDIPVSFPLATGEQSLNVIITGAVEKDPEDVFVWKKYEAMTGVNINWTNVTKANREEMVLTALTNHQKYDLIMRCKLSSTKLLSYGREGLIIDLAKDDLLKKNAPNCWAYLQSHPDTLASVMNPDGSIYALPQVNSGAELRVAAKLFVNKLWLDRVNMELPTTTQELYTVLTAFKEQDANGNGDINDEIPFCNADWTTLQASLYGAFGLGNRGFHNFTVDSDPVTGKARFIAGSDEYKAFIEYMRMLYEDGLVSKQLFSLPTVQWQAYIDTDRIGVFPMTNLAWIPADKIDNWVAIDTALTGPNGDDLWSAVRACFHSTGAAVIPSTCTDPGLVLRWLDYFWTDEGTLFYHMGVENETYTVMEDGSYDYVQRIYDEMTQKNLSFDSVVSEYSPYPGGNNPTVEIAPYFMGGEMASEPARAAKALIEYGLKEYWPSFTFTQEENNILNGIKTDLNKYIDNMRNDFISGVRSMDEWDAYINKLSEFGAPQMLAIYQAAVDRYHTLMDALE